MGKRLFGKEVGCPEPWHQAVNCDPRANYRFSPRSVAEAVTGPAGHHGQAVAYAARELGIKLTVVLPENTTPIKRQAARAYGAPLEFSETTSA